MKKYLCIKTRDSITTPGNPLYIEGKIYESIGSSTRITA